MDREYKALSNGDGSSSGSRAKKALPKQVRQFNGALTLTATEFSRAEECMRNKGNPSEGAVEGAALLRRLYRK